MSKLLETLSPAFRFICVFLGVTFLLLLCMAPLWVATFAGLYFGVKAL